MARNAKIVKVDRYETVTYYSVTFEGDKNSEFDRFYEKFKGNEKVKVEFGTILELLITMGNDDAGANPNMFRPERKIHALPPYGYEGDLRLYCVRFTRDIVVLFNGGIKTERTFQECPNVGPIHSKCVKIYEAIQKEIDENYIDVSSREKFSSSIKDCELWVH